jgi:hypothetical protein
MSQAVVHTITNRRPKFAVFRRTDDAWLIALCDRHATQLTALNSLFDRYAPADPPELLRAARALRGLQDRDELPPGLGLFIAGRGG